MNTLILRAREMSLALLVIAVIDHGYAQLQADYFGAAPNSSGLMRLGRDLMRRAGREGATEASVPA
jgi:hypothetical protein